MERGAKSLFSQSFDSIEYIFIDDCSIDNSVDLLLKVLDKFPERKPYVKIIRNNSNMGVGQSRQLGIEAATGDYIIHCDSDDWVDSDMYKKMYEKAIETDAEIVVCNYLYLSDSGYKLITQTPYNCKRLLFKQFANETLHSSLCIKLISNKLAKSVRIQPGINHWEDFSITPYLMLKADKIAYIDIAPYHYDTSNKESLSSKNVILNAYSSINAIKSLLQKMHDDNLIDIVDPLDIYRLQWSAKKGLLLEPSRDSIKLWQNTFSDSNTNYKQIGISRKFQFLTWLAIHNQYHLLKAYKLAKSIPSRLLGR